MSDANDAARNDQDAYARSQERADEITRLTARVQELEEMVNQSEAMALGYATENAALTARVEKLEAIREEYRNRLKQFGAENGSLDAAEKDAIARAALTKGESRD